jgi:hypothetical protein
MEHLCVVYTSNGAFSRFVEVLPCPACPPQSANFTGPETRTLGYFNYKNRRIFSHELLDDFTNRFTRSHPLHLTHSSPPPLGGTWSIRAISRSFETTTSGIRGSLLSSCNLQTTISLACVVEPSLELPLAAPLPVMTLSCLEALYHGVSATLANS